MYAYAAFAVFIVVVTVFLVDRVDYFDSLYAFHSADINVSYLCNGGEPSVVLFYGPNTTSTYTEIGSFVNTTSLFGLWTGDRFYSGYFCAWKFNVSAYNQNASSVDAPLSAMNLFDQLSQGRVPLIVFNGEYYKIGGFTNATAADNEILRYICLSINSSAPQCG